MLLVRIIVLNIIGNIKITKMYFGTRFQYPENKELKALITNYET